MFDEMNECNASTFAIFWGYKNPHKFFRQFSFGATIMNQALKTIWILIFEKYGKF